jgi:Patatin-like phospholipase/NADP oxidoreductase coenzyme F420-dependent
LRKLALALSGGGHRATVFSLGALLYLVDCGRNRDVRTITSVSGGSLTNAYFSLLDTPFNELTRDQFRVECARLAHQISGSPCIFWLSWTIYPLLWVTIWLLLGPQFHIPFWASMTIFIASVILWALLIGPQSQGTLWGWWGTWLYVGALVAGIVAIPVTSSLSNWGWAFLVLGATLFTLSQRHRVAGMAFSETLGSLSTNANVRLGRSPKSKVRHIFCATELHVGRHIFFSRDFVYTTDFGLGVPGSLRIGDAVQLSANFPGGFPFRRLCADMFRFVGTRRAKLLVVTDGGGYDNTATSWYLESQEIAFQIERLQKGEKLAREARAKFEGAKEAAEVVSAKARGLQKAQEALEVDRSATKAQEAVEDLDRHVLAVHPEIVQSVLNELNDSSYDLITINAAYPPAIQHASLASLPVLSDLLTFTKTTETLYNNDNHQRLRHLRRLFLNKDLNGALVSVEEHPAQLATYLCDPEKWFSGRLSETITLVGPEAKASRIW